MKLKFSTAIRTGVLALAVPSCGLAAASPVLTLTGTRELGGPPFSVELTYTLEDAPGIVLFDVLTNGVSIGGANIQRVSGDVNRGYMTPTGVTETIRYRGRDRLCVYRAIRNTAPAQAPAAPPAYMEEK